jgi:hypothetical protein
VQVDHPYGVVPGALLDVLVDPGFLTSRSARYGGVGAPTVQRAGPLVEVRTVRQLPLEHVPTAFRRFVGAGRVEQLDAWPVEADGDVTGRWLVDTGRAPIELRGEHRIVGAAGGCRYSVSAQVTVTVPVLAGRLSRQVETYLRQLIAAEQAFLANWLEESGRG